METLGRQTLEARDETQAAYREGYQDLDGNPYWSSTELKNILAGRLTTEGVETDSTELGAVVHKWIEGQLKDKRPYMILDPFLSDEGKVLRKGSKTYVERWREAEAKHGRGNFTILTDSDMAKWGRTAPGLMAFVDDLKTRGEAPGTRLHIERAFLVGWAALSGDAGAIAKAPLGKKPALSVHLEALRQQLVKHEGFCVRAMPDVVVEKADSCQILDWKTTSKETARAMHGQAGELRYWLSLYYYALAVEMVLGKPVTSMQLVMIPKGRESLVRFTHPMGANPLGWDMRELKTLGTRLSQGLALRKRWRETALLDYVVSEDKDGRPTVTAMSEDFKPENL